jgi:hypothetical protein
MNDHCSSHTVCTPFSLKRAPKSTIISVEKINDVDFGACFSENGEHAVRELQRYIDELPWSFEFMKQLKTNLKHLKSALAREADYLLSIKNEGMPWNDSITEITYIFTGFIRLDRRRKSLYFSQGISFKRLKVVTSEDNKLNKNRDCERRIDWDPDELDIYCARERARNQKSYAKAYREKVELFIHTMATNLSRRSHGVVTATSKETFYKHYKGGAKFFGATKNSSSMMMRASTSIPLTARTPHNRTRMGGWRLVSHVTVSSVIFH